MAKKVEKNRKVVYLASIPDGPRLIFSSPLKAIAWSLRNGGSNTLYDHRSTNPITKKEAVSLLHSMEMVIACRPYDEENDAHMDHTILTSTTDGGSDLVLGVEIFPLIVY